MSQPRVGVYPGTFDPITNGHTDIILRATKIVDRLVIGVARNDRQGAALHRPTSGSRSCATKSTHLENGDAERIEVRAFDTLLMHFAQSVGASVIIRGLRAVSDFEYEFQMAGMNTRLNPRVETVFLMASDRYQFISSRFVKEIGALGGDVSHFVSPRVACASPSISPMAAVNPAARWRANPGRDPLAATASASARTGSKSG